jgi:transcriptional regulator with XRE-family HTH domain
VKLKDFRRKRMQYPEMQAAYQELRPKLELGRQILDARLERGWTQKELAEKAGTKQANISRLENALLNPTIEMLQKLANALGTQLDLQLVPEEEAVQADHSDVELKAPRCIITGLEEPDLTAQGPWMNAPSSVRFLPEAGVIIVGTPDESASASGQAPIPALHWPVAEERLRTNLIAEDYKPQRLNS